MTFLAIHLRTRLHRQCNFWGTKGWSLATARDNINHQTRLWVYSCLHPAPHRWRMHQQPSLSDPLMGNQFLMPSYHNLAGTDLFVPVMAPGSAAGSASQSALDPVLMQMQMQLCVMKMTECWRTPFTGFIAEAGTGISFSDHCPTSGGSFSIAGASSCTSEVSIACGGSSARSTTGSISSSGNDSTHRHPVHQVDLERLMFLSLSVLGDCDLPVGA